MDEWWAYIRVSGDPQADRGVPVAGQREAIARYATEHHLNLTRFFVDEAQKGSTDAREQFQQMMHLAHDDPPPCKAIVLWSWSRFARDQDDAHFWKASLRRHGVQIVDISGEAPPSDEFQYIFESMIHWKDELRLKEISRDSRRGQQTLARMGYVPSGCAPPRGYRVATEEKTIEGKPRTLRRWVPDEETWPYVLRAWQLRLGGASYATIQHEVPLYRANGCWCTFFGNPIYKGELRFGGTIIPVQPAVSAEEWAMVNRNRGQRKSGAYARRQGSRYLLSGLLSCARCGSALCAGHSVAGVRNDGHRREAWPFYMCLRHRSGDCDLPRVDSRALESAVIEELFARVLTTENLAEQMEAIRKRLETERPLFDLKVNGLQKEIRELDRGIARLLDAIERAPDFCLLSPLHTSLPPYRGVGGVREDKTDPLVERLCERNLERERLRAELVSVQAQMEGPGAIPDVEVLRDTLQGALEHGPPEEARAFLKTIIASIVVNDQEATIRYRLPFGPPTHL